MADFPSLPLWTDAFMADTSHLNATETGAYLMLLMAAWRSPDCRLPADDRRLARMARCDGRTWSKVKPVVLSFWFADEGGWLQQKRLSREYKKCSTTRSQRMTGGVARGAQIAAAKRLKSLEVVPASATAERQVTISISKSIDILSTQHSTTAACATPQGAARAEGETLVGKLKSAAGWEAEPSPGLANTGPIEALLAEGLDLDRDVLPVVRAKAANVGSRTGWEYFARAIRGDRERQATRPPVIIETIDAGQPPRRIVVIDGTPQMAAWDRASGPRGLPRADVVDPATGKPARGWYVPSEYPPDAAPEAQPDDGSDLEIPECLKRRRARG